MCCLGWTHLAGTTVPLVEMCFFSRTPTYLYNSVYTVLLTVLIF